MEAFGGSRTHWAGILIAVVVTALLPASATAVPRSCGWPLEFGGDQLNAIWPDESANYWVSVLPVPGEAHIEIRGRFPHARYLSFNAYGGRLAAIDAIADYEIQPDPGSVNPFVPGADRNAENRSYTVRVANAGRPANGSAPNTLYAGGSGFAGFVLRVYTADLGMDPTGGVGLPELTLVRENGERTPIPACPDTGVPNAGSTETVAASGAPLPATEQAVAARNPPRWHKFTNNAALITDQTLDNAVTAPVADALTEVFDANLAGGGIGETLHNSYATTTISPELGQVLVLRGKSPVTPRTLGGDAVMGTGQLRYWSICSYSAATPYYGCRHDETIPVDRKGRYTIALSTAAARPDNAREACGVTWLPMGPAPQATLFIRHLLASPDFAEALQRVDPGSEAEQMGDYHPSGTYYATQEEFEQLGCSAKKQGGGR